MFYIVVHGKCFCSHLQNYSSDMKFPVYRKSRDGKSMYRFNSPEEMVELLRTGNRVDRFDIKAEKYPDRIRIQELLANEDGGLVESNEAAFEALKAEVSH